MKRKKILILGGAGYIGSVLAPRLQEEGYQITVVDIGWFGNRLPSSIRYIQDDAFNLKQQQFEGYDTVIFLAGLSNDPMAEFSPKDNFIYNTALPAYAGHMAKQAGVNRFIFASSCSVYGFTGNIEMDETGPALSAYPYGVSKLQGEKSLLALASDTFSVICFRQGTVSGYSPRMRLDLAINTMFKNAIQNREIILSNATIRRPILGLEDLSRAYTKAIESPLTGGHVFNICSFNTTIGELAERVADFVEKHHHLKVTITDKKVNDKRNYAVTNDKARCILNYNPIQNDLDIFFDLHRHLPLFSNFDDEIFSNIAVFKKISMFNQLAS